MRGIRQAAFWLAAAVVAAAPWFYGAWEVWWFWPLATAVFVASALFAVLLFSPDALAAGVSGERWRRAAWPALAGCLAMLAYALVRAAGARVYTDAERSFLLLLTPCLLGSIIAFAGSRRSARLFHALILADMLALGAYAIVNHWRTGSEFVLGVPGFAQYIRADRATGTYFCPDHFAGLMEIGFGLALAQVAARRARWPARLGAAVVGAVAVWVVVLTKSRGGGLTLGVLLLLAVTAGISPWPALPRWGLRGGLLALAAAGALLLPRIESGYVERFKSYPWSRIQDWDRYRMMMGAMRAWRTAPVFGIGPGMHRNLWPRFAATEDGDREAGIWPSIPNLTFHSYEVHNDWVQLMEEYGTVGLALFLVAATGVLGPIVAARRRGARGPAPRGTAPPAGGDDAILMGALYAVAAMAFHSLGDFNLQIPATNWMLGAVIGLAFGAALRAPAPGEGPR